MHKISIGGHELNFDTPKSEAEAIRDYIAGKLLELNKWCRELTGHVNGVTYESELMNFFGSYPLPDPDGYKKAVDEFFEWFPDPYVKADEQELRRRVKEIRDAHMPTTDKRLTDEEVKARQEKIDADSREYRERQEKIFQQLGVSEEEIKTPDGYMAVYLQCTYNDSDMMADHYHPDAGYGPPQLLANVPKGARTEKLARSVIAKYPELAKLNWSWQKSDGRYATPQLIGPAMGICEHLPDRPDKPNYIYRIYLGCFRENLNPYKNYGKNSSAQTPATAENTVPDFTFSVEIGGLTVSGKTDRDWTWITFSAHPPQEIVNRLNALDFNPSKKMPVKWYAKQRVPQEKIMAALGVDKEPAEEKTGGLKVMFVSAEKLLATFADYALHLEGSDGYQEFKMLDNQDTDQPVDPPFDMMIFLDSIGFTALGNVWITENPIQPSEFITSLNAANLKI